ncbi:MAG: ribulose-phosphate 3-epimerase [Pseudomonadota bacterium]
MIPWPPAQLRIAPSILAADYAALGDAASACQAAGADWLHLDVMDGHFVPNISFGAGVVAALRSRVTIPFDVHLMISPVEPYLAAFAEAGADGITIHIEATQHADRALEDIAARGLRPGIAINPQTPASAVVPVLHRVALINVMTVNPGFGGQAYLPNASQKLAEVKAVVGERPILIECDGGINRDTASAAHRAGANVLVAGSAVFGARNLHEAVSALKRAALSAD